MIISTPPRKDILKGGYTGIRKVIVRRGFKKNNLPKVIDIPIIKVMVIHVEKQML